MRTASRETLASLTTQLTTAALGFAGEGGEFAEQIKKFLYHGHRLDVEKLEKEVGDILWYCALAAKGLGTDLDAIAEANIRKLEARYPDGFSTERSLHRPHG